MRTIPTKTDSVKTPFFFLSKLNWQLRRQKILQLVSKTENWHNVDRHVFVNK